MGNNGNGTAPHTTSPNGAGAHDDALPAGSSAAGTAGGVGVRPQVLEAFWPARIPATLPRTAADETLDLGSIARTLGRGWRTLALGALLGALVGIALARYFPPRYRGSASVLVRNANDPTGSVLSKFGVSGDIAGAAAGGALGGVLKSSLETELQLLGSRELLGQVVDSLALQARVLSPRGVPSAAVLRPGTIRGAFQMREAAFRRTADGTYRVELADGSATLTPGRAGTIPGVGVVTLAPTGLPPEFSLRLMDREDAISDLSSHLSVEKKGGELVDVRYTARDSLTAAAVPNAIIAAYLEERRTVDRGLNQRRYEFMAAQADSVATQLAAAEDALRREQQSTGVFDPEEYGKSGLEAIQQVRSQLIGLDAERRAARILVDAVERGTLPPRQLAAFPAFLRAPSINSILSQITMLETERTRLLGTRTERDPDVAVLSQGIADLERGLRPLATTYAGSLDTQVQELEGQQRAIEGRLEQLPAQAEGGLRRQREVRRLSQTMLGLQAQMIDARLSALGEGGQVRAVDVAAAPKRPLFPRALYTVPGGLLLGLLGTVVLILARGAWSSRIRSIVDAERATGLPVVAFREGGPLLLGLGARTGTLLAVAADRATSTRVVTEVLTAQARARGQTVTAVDAQGGKGTDGAAPGAALREAVARAEAEHDAVYVATPPVTDVRTAELLELDRAVAVVAREGVTTREALAEAAQHLARLGAPVVGVVLETRRRA